MSFQFTVQATVEQNLNVCSIKGTSIQTIFCKNVPLLTGYYTISLLRP